MAVINTGLLTKGLRSEFFNRFRAVNTHYQELATRVPSTTETEVYRWLGTVPKMREWGSGRLARGLRVESYSIDNLKLRATGLRAFSTRSSSSLSRCFKLSSSSKT
jgi:phage major head subunit gpT-like protein